MRSSNIKSLHGGTYLSAAVGFSLTPGPDFVPESLTGGSGAHQARHMKLALLFNRSNKPMAFPGRLIYSGGGGIFP